MLSGGGRRVPGGVASVVFGVIGLTGLVIPSIIAIAVGSEAESRFEDDPAAYDKNLGAVGKRLGFAGLGISVVLLIIQVATNFAF